MDKYIVRGQPEGYMDIKYENTYSRCAIPIMKNLEDFKEITALGLLATNSNEILDHIKERIQKAGSPPPTVNSRIVVEKDPDTYRLILEKEFQLYKREGDFYSINTDLKNLVWKEGSLGRKPSAAKEISRSQEKFAGKVNFFDFDFMHNWGKIEDFEPIISIINMYASKKSVAHINAVSDLARSWWLSKKEKEVKNIVEKVLIHQLKQNFKVEMVDEPVSYITKKRNTTKMTSVVLALDRR